ncbi:hypothetical protein AOLI_G00114050 [Acnodon oligacanthus]
MPCRTVQTITTLLTFVVSDIFLSFIYIRTVTQQERGEKKYSGGTAICHNSLKCYPGGLNPSLSTLNRLLRCFKVLSHAGKQGKEYNS